MNGCHHEQINGMAFFSRLEIGQLYFAVEGLPWTILRRALLDGSLTIRRAA